MAYLASENRYADKSSDKSPGKPWFRRCGTSGLMLPALSLGCWHNFGAPGTDSGHHGDDSSFHENCRQMLFTAFDHGITHFDLANNYGPPPGAAESRVGRILREDFAGYRDELIISTKAGYGMWLGPYGDWGSRKYLLASLDASLQRLGLEYVDIFYHHRPDPGTPLEETLGALDSAVKSGKALYTAISNYPGALTATAVEVCRRERFTAPILHQPKYNMFARGPETDLFPTTADKGIGVIPFCPLAQGLLTNKYLTDIPADSRATLGGFLKAESITPEKRTQLQKLNTLAKQRGQSLAQMSLAWVLRLPAVTTALIGASRPSQITENIAALKSPALTGEELTQIDSILAA